jgi:hypothetical protein
MEITIEEFGLRFTTPENPTVAEIMLYDSKRVDMANTPIYLGMWEMAKTLIQEWECELMPDYKVELNKITDLRIARLVEQAGNAVLAWRLSLDKVSKN